MAQDATDDGLDECRSSPAGKQDRMTPLLQLDGVAPNPDQVSSPVAMPPAVPFPASPITPTSSSPPPPHRYRPALFRSPRNSHDSSESPKRLSIASTASTASSTSMVQRPLVLMRTRHSSLPAPVLQSRHQSIVGTPAANQATAGSRVKALNRISIASVGSFGSVEEENEDAGEVSPSSSRVPSRSPSLSSTKSGASIPLRPNLRSQNARYSLPPPGGSLPSFSSVLSLRGSRTRSSSPLRQNPVKSYSDAEKAQREERRLRIAEELRDTEKAYVRVLEEIDASFYQPLLRALPPTDPLARHSSSRYSSTAASPHPSPRSSAYDSSPRSQTLTSDAIPSASPSPVMTTPSTAATSPSSPPTSESPVLSRRELNEIFSNFTDVLNLSHVMLLTLAEAVPERSVAAHLTKIPSTSSTTGMSLPEKLVGAQSNVSERTHERGTQHDDPLEPQPLIRASPTNESALDPRTPRRRSAAPPLRLGKALLPIVPFFKQYSLFVANFSGSLSRLSQLERDDSDQRWKSFVRTRTASAQGVKIGLGGMLLNIVQRVPRYRLLLLDLLKYTERDHPDLKDLEMAFALVDSVATHLDSQIESHTHDLAILDLQRNFVDLDFPLLAPGRRLVKSGPIRKWNRAGKEQTRVLFLFNDVLIHAAPVEQSSSWGLGISGVATHGEFPSGGTTLVEQSYRFVDKFELDDVTVVGTEGDRLKYGFEILSTTKSFAVYADSFEAKMAWLEAVRDAKAALMSDRFTLRRATTEEPITYTVNQIQMRADRRVSLPSPSKSPPSVTGGGPSTRTSTRQASLAPRLGMIPPTPAVELQSLEFPLSPSTARTEESSPSPAPPPAPASTPRPASTGSSFCAFTGSPSQRRPSLSRTRRWSEMRPSDAVHAIASVLLPASAAAIDDLARDEVEYKVIEAYHAPVWVPDSKAKKCLRCAEKFGLWRRKHHCRLCGAVVCWACSTNYFIIPAYLLPSSASPHSLTNAISSSDTAASKPSQEDRLARSCDTCYSAVFDDPVPSSRFLGSATPAATFGRSTLQPCVDKTATLHRLSRIINPREMPLFDELVAAASDNDERSVVPPTTTSVPRAPMRGGTESHSVSPSAEKKKRRRLTAVGTLQSLLANQT